MTTPITEADYTPDAIDIALQHKNNLVLSLWTTLVELQRSLDAEQSELMPEDKAILSALEGHVVVRRAIREKAI